MIYRFNDIHGFKLREHLLERAENRSALLCLACILIERMCKNDYSPLTF